MLELTYERYKRFKDFTICVFGYNDKRPDEVVIEHINLGHKYYVTCFKKPKIVANELRRIANWLDTL